MSGSSSSGSSQSGSHAGSHVESHAGSQVPSEGSGSCGSGHSHSTSPEVVLLQGNNEDTAMGGEEDAGHLEDEETLSQGTVSLLDISTSDNEDARKATARMRRCTRATSSMVTGGMNKSARGRKALTQHDKGVNDYA